MPIRSWMIFFLPLLLAACTERGKEEAGQKLFQEQPTESTGIRFSNTITQSGDNNVLAYPYYYNGGGVAAGDLNNDGLIDLYFTGNQVPNKLYLNKGDLKFEDITEKAGISVPSGWKTGVTLADVNQDGWLDLYVCRSAMGDSTLRKNLLFINNGDLTFSEQADVYGVSDNSYSTQAAFLDYDKDNDLDLFVLNHSLPQYGGFSKMMGTLKNKRGQKFGSKLFRNDHGKFSDVSTSAGIINNVLSFGLGVAVSDFNQDGWPDLYISNDFNEEDYLYINQRNGTFQNTVKEATGHVSLFSMGSDAADVNNDALPDLVTLDMLPASNTRIKLSSGDDNYDKYEVLVGAGFHHQSMRNMLQLNNGDGTFSEIGQLAGISNTDWSWAPLFADFDGDGWKDLFVSNGYEKDYTNMQFLKFTVDEQLKARRTGQAPDLKLIMEKMPSIEEGNFIFRNQGNLTFTKSNNAWGLSRTFKSNGAASADLDNDGDPDLVINVMNGPAVIYKNTAVENTGKKFLKIDLSKSGSRLPVEGTRVLAYVAGQKQYFEFSPTRGFQSSMHAPITVGLDTNRRADSVRILWPDNQTHVYRNVGTEKVFAPALADAHQRSTAHEKNDPAFVPEDLIAWKHEAFATNDFKRQFLLPKMYSYSGPRIARADVNGDGLMDLYFCGAKDQPGALFRQNRDGGFDHVRMPAFEKDKGSQDEDALFFDADGDGDNDLYVVSGGYCFAEADPLLQDRLYVNDGNGNFTRSLRALPAETSAGSSVAPIDVDRDGDTDLFVGGRFTPGKYPQAPESLFLLNNGKGEFIHAIDRIAPELKHAGMITDVRAADFNHDGVTDLAVAGEWMPLSIWISRNGALVNESSQMLSGAVSGWWNCLIADDFDNDGDIDLVAGNYGMNNQFNVSPTHPATLVYKDFNNDGQVDPFFCYYIDGQSYPYASRDEALNQVTFLRPRYPEYTSYASATLETMFKPEELKDAHTLKADQLKTVYLENTGNKFDTRELPAEAQFSPVYAITSIDIDRDGDRDLLLAGNDTHMRVRLGKMDANHGVVLRNDGHGKFTTVPSSQNGLTLRGDVRGLTTVESKKGTWMVAGVNDSEVACYRLVSASATEANAGHR